MKNLKSLLCLLLALLTLCSLAACDGGQGKETEPTDPQQTEPKETLPAEGNQVGNLCYGYDLPVVDENGATGETVNPVKTGKVTVINFWGTWCGPCISEMPHLEELAKNYGDTLTVIAVHSTDGRKKMPAFIADHYADSPIIFSWEETGQYNGDYCVLLGGGQGYPYTVVLDAQGVITHKQLGMMSYEQMQEMAEAAGAQKKG